MPQTEEIILTMNLFPVLFSGIFPPYAISYLRKFFGYLVDLASTICLSKRLSHASVRLSICERLIKTVINYLTITLLRLVLDNPNNFRANPFIRK